MNEIKFWVSLVFGTQARYSRVHSIFYELVLDVILKHFIRSARATSFNRKH